MTQITHADVKDLRAWFHNHVATFKRGDANLRRNMGVKEEHTLNVCAEITGVGEELGLSREDLLLAEIAALFHDIGRFAQFAQYGTLVDRTSVDHAQLGIRVLHENDTLRQLDEGAQDLICRAISYHNRPALPAEETETCLFLSKLLRDADKLDIWRVVTNIYRRGDEGENSMVELDLPNTPGFSSEAYQALMEKRTVSVAHLRNLNDFKLCHLSWVYDINFLPTFQRIKRRGYLATIHEALPRAGEIDTVCAIAQAYLDEKLGPRENATGPTP